MCCFHSLTCGYFSLSQISSEAQSTSSCSPPPGKLREGLCSAPLDQLSETIHQDPELISATESTSDEIPAGHLSQCAQKEVRWSCLGGHRGTWTSSPYLWEAFPEIHLLTALSILFSGGTFVQFKKWADHLHLNFMANETFFVVHLGRARHEASEVKCLQDRWGCLSLLVYVSAASTFLRYNLGSSLHFVVFSFEEMEVSIEKDDDGDCNSVKNRL